MKSKSVIRFLFCILAVLISSCASAPATAVPTSAPAVESGPVSFVWSTAGDEKPLETPSGITIDAQGNLYVVDTLNHQIRVFNAEGVNTADWGELGSSEGQFNFAWKPGLSANDQDEVTASVALDRAGNVYVADVGNSRIQKFDQQGKFIAAWPTTELEGGGPSQVYDLAIDSQGNIYAVDLKYFVTKYDSQGRLITRWGGPGVEDGFIGESGGLALDSNDNVYVTHIFQSSIKKFDSSGKLLAEFTLPPKESSIAGEDPNNASPFGIFIDRQGNIYTTDFLNNRILVLDSSGQFLREWGRQGGDAGLLYGPVDIAVDAEGNIYVSETYNNRVQKFKPAE